MTSVQVDHEENFQEVLFKYNNEQPGGTAESIKLSINLLKINKRNKRQQRLFILTNKAIYNVKPNKKKSIRRRVALHDIALITKSSKSAEFTLSIPSQYDYRFDATDKPLRDKIISAISQQMMNINHDILINTINDATTALWTVTKNDIKNMNVQYYKSIRIVLALDHLHKMGFNKSKMVAKVCGENKGDLSHTIVALLEYYVEQLENDDEAMRSPFISKSTTPFVVKVRPRSPSITASVLAPLAPSQSFTELVDDGFRL